MSHGTHVHSFLRSILRIFTAGQPKEDDSPFEWHGDHTYLGDDQFFTLFLLTEDGDPIVRNSEERDAQISFTVPKPIYDGSPEIDYYTEVAQLLEYAIDERRTIKIDPRQLRSLIMKYWPNRRTCHTLLILRVAEVPNNTESIRFNRITSLWTQRLNPEELLLLAGYLYPCLLHGHADEPLVR